jgi:transcriptional regulator GlxA family with amidase domain
MLAAPLTQLLDLAGPYQVFKRAVDVVLGKHPSAVPPYRIEVATTDRGLLQTCGGLRVEGHRNFDEVGDRIDTLIVVGGTCVEEGRVERRVVEWVKKASRRSRRVCSVCTGAFLLAEAGLLDHKTATTHWKYGERLARRFPSIEVDADPIFTRSGNVYTSAGVTAGMDLALALVEEDLGSDVALQVARELVLYLRRPGSQSQFSAVLLTQMSEKQPLRELPAWILEHLTDDLSGEALARHVCMSIRNFYRLFVEEFSMTPAKMVESIRLEAVRRRLQESHEGLKKIASECGFRSADVMSSVFKRVIGVSPGEYRERFGTIQDSKRS